MGAMATSKGHRLKAQLLSLTLALGFAMPAHAADPMQGQASTAEVNGAPVPNRALDQLRTEAAETAGALFVDEDKVIVKPPVLKALITLNRSLSPYALDARGAQTIGLPDVLRDVIAKNLDIKISNTDVQTSKWMYYGALGRFLPDLSNGMTLQGLHGHYASPFGLLSKIKTPYISFPTGMQWNFFQGGTVLFGALQNKHLYRAAQFEYSRTSNDMMLDATDLYYKLVLNDILLQIRIKAVETSQALLLRNQIQFENGANTKLDVLQARAQLSRDKQALISQQVARRSAAVKLARALNLDSSVDLSTADGFITKIRLVDDGLQIGDLLQVAIDNRPELKKYEQLRLASKDAVRVAFGALLPTVYMTAGAIGTGAKVAPVSGNTGGSSAAGGGLLTGGGFSASSANGVGLNTNTKKFSMAEMFQIGMGVQWTLGGMGTTEGAAVVAARWQARKAQLEFSRQLAFVYQEVRDAYLEVLEADSLIKETTDAVNASREELDVATIRLEESVGTDLEVVNAQRDFTDALINKANALIKFNTAEARLLRAMGKISYTTLTASRPMAIR
jgi:OMF family outer membrane factor